MSANVRHARHTTYAAAPLLLLAAVTAFPTAAQAQAPVVVRAHAIVPRAPETGPLRFAASDEVADLRFEVITPLPATLTLADLRLGVPILVQTVTRDGRPVHTALTWRIVSGDAASISADRRTDRGGFATATLGQELGELQRPGRVVIEARTRPPGAGRDLAMRLSTVLVRK